jgi:hypothetical protein
MKNIGARWTAKPGDGQFDQCLGTVADGMVNIDT